MDKKQEEDFYRELDDNQIKLNQGCLKVFIFFVIILVIGGLIVFFLALKLRKVSELTFSNPEITPTTQIEVGSEQEIIVTDLDLNNFIDQNQKNIPIQYLKGNITPDGIKFKGIWQALDSRIELVLFPTVFKSQVNVEVRSVTVGGMRVPSWLGGQVSNMVEQVIKNRLPKNSKVTQISNLESQIILKVQNE